MLSANKAPQSSLDTVVYFDRLLADLGVTDEMLAEQRVGSSYPVNGIPVEINGPLFNGLEHLEDDQRIPARDDESIVLVRDSSERTYKIYFAKDEDGKFSAYAFQRISRKVLAEESQEVRILREFMGELFS